MYFDHTDSAMQLQNQFEVENNKSATQRAINPHRTDGSSGFIISSLEIEGSRFRYQIDYDPYPDSRYYFEKWRSGSR